MQSFWSFEPDIFSLIFHKKVCSQGSLQLCNPNNNSRFNQKGIQFILTCSADFPIINPNDPSRRDFPYYLRLPGALKWHRNVSWESIYSFFSHTSLTMSLNKYGGCDKTFTGCRKGKVSSVSHATNCFLQGVLICISLFPGFQRRRRRRCSKALDSISARQPSTMCVSPRGILFIPGTGLCSSLIVQT